MSTTTRRSSEFEITRNMFREYTRYTSPLSYDQWSALADDLKAAVLYCQFYDQITLAWNKLKSVYSDESDGVAEVLQYLQKNVAIIQADSKRFTPAYIYRVVYNCLYCLCRDPNLHKKAFENECSPYVEYDGEELSWFDLISTDSDMLHTMMLETFDRQAFWDTVYSIEGDIELLVAKLLNDYTRVNCPKATLLDIDEHKSQVEQLGRWTHSTVTLSKQDKESMKPTFRKVRGHTSYSEREMSRLTSDREAELLEELKQVLSKYRDVFNI